MKLLPYTRATERQYASFLRLPEVAQKLLLASLCRVNHFRIDRLKTPIILTFFVTNRCNARCKHCFYWQDLQANNASELTLGEIKKIIASLKHRLSTVLLTGGEPFLRQDLASICRAFYDLNQTKKINIPTNGLEPQLIDQTAQKITRCKGLFLNVVVSLDGLGKNHDLIRGVPGAFEKVITTVRRLKKLEKQRPNFKVGIQTVVSSRNYKEIGQLAHFVQSEFNITPGFQFIRGSHSGVYSLNPAVSADFNPPDKSFRLPSPERLRQVNRLINTQIQTGQNQLLARIDQVKRGYLLQIMKQKKRLFPCLAGKIDGVIYPSGEVALCEYTTSFANLKNFAFDFERLWNSPEANQRRAQTTHCACTHPCNVVNSMRYDLKTLLKLASPDEKNR
ncbi:hypothetical protein COU97_01160 [Candidatus Shapirobacteria bacterium CG10_big_fil_rev_8_21_14_0_10_48_15]|uniref:Radical SAM core domain-containing protein n=1 Tax=Candidatus Shapirobacteria bacterium CG10_big_fil_rev_8_21_14_0_10_48_15 TaxID=1974484 RepID=A0A2M8L7E4_9BACT|nr:MAG: hypothetical protein COU97_01160 [Candidatus Shapirobacteria bacterium CG10_big_fil_rev_8_21_14_0_10_48_15]